jgi:hypothetical protein
MLRPRECRQKVLLGILGVVDPVKEAGTRLSYLGSVLLLYNVDLNRHRRLQSVVQELDSLYCKLDTSFPPVSETGSGSQQLANRGLAVPAHAHSGGPLPGTPQQTGHCGVLPEGAERRCLSRGKVQSSR